MKKLAFLCTSLVGLSACSNHANDFDSQSATEQWNRYHSETISSIKLQEKQAIAVFYRAEAETKGSINVYVNGDYQASLLQNSFSPVAVCADKPLFSSSYVSGQAFGERVHGLRPSLNEGSINYFKVVTVNNKPIFEAVSAEQAQADFAGLNGEIRHTLPRVVRTNRCDTIQTNVLSASTLWSLNKYSYADMLEQGKRDLAEFAENVKSNPAITNIEVNGFTDPQASDAYNQTLSQRRADTVRQALIQAGVTQPINATGYGETDLVVSDCALKHPHNLKARVACDLPNRRVEIRTYGK